MTYEYLDHEAEVGILATADTLEEAFSEGAKGLFGIMVKLEDVKPEKEIKLECSAGDVAALFAEWLNELICLKDMHFMFFCEFKVNIKKDGDEYKLTATAKGEEINADKHQLETEVKAATYSGLKYEEKKGKHILQIVVDV